MDNKILTEEAKETEKEAGKEVENGVSASDEAIKAVEAMKAAASAQQAEEDAVYIEPGMAWRKTLKSLEEEIEKELNDGIVSGKYDGVVADIFLKYYDDIMQKAMQKAEAALVMYQKLRKSSEQVYKNFTN